MRPISVREMMQATGAVPYPEARDVRVTSVKIDSREVGEDSLFVAMKGERVDSHRFIGDVFANGAKVVFAQNDFDVHGVRVPDDGVILLTKDPVEALGQLAKWYRQTLSIPVIAVTGSVGKTSAKDMICACLSGGKKTFKTPGNWNNRFGVPLAVLSIGEDDEAAVIEMGMNHFGEIRYLSDIVRPNIGVITNIGVSHIEYLGSREGILKAKTEMLEFMDENSFLLVNGDDDLLGPFAQTISIPHATFGFTDGCDWYPTEVEADDALRLQVGGLRLNVPTLGRHMVYSVLPAVAIARRLGLNDEQIRQGLAAFVPSGSRMKITAGRFTVLDDSYNAAPASMKAAIDVLCAHKAMRHVAILGDMFEMGSYAERGHREVGDYLREKPVDVLVCAGENARFIAQNAPDTIEKHVFATTEAMLGEVARFIDDGDTVLVKASHGMNFADVVDKLAEVQ